MQVEQAVALVHATGGGTITTLLATVEDKPDRQLSTVARATPFLGPGSSGTEKTCKDVG